MSNDTPASAAPSRDWSKTLFLPKTDFPMKAGLPQLEPKLLARWEQLDLYAKLRAAAKGKARFTLHDGPPYANGNIHIGHALNKILKDLVTRSQQMLGFDSNYVPGWDCHGLPIEWKIEEDYIAKGKPKPNLKDPAALKAFRAECRAFAEHWLGVQREEFKRLGVEGDWKNPYSTMTFPAEAAIARELMSFADTGQLYRGSKPVMWSVVEQTALAEAEVEYQDFQSDAVYVKFPVKSWDRDYSEGQVRHWEELGSAVGVNPNSADGVADRKKAQLDGAFIVIWTTTPWTIPGNRAISFSSRIDYVLCEAVDAPKGNWLQSGERIILADNDTLIENVRAASKVGTLRHIRQIDSNELLSITCAHPLAAFVPSPPAGEGQGGGEASASTPHPPPHPNPPPQGGRESVRGRGYSFAVPLLDGDHVTDDAGTGFVHTAPGHGREDFDIWTASTRLLVSLDIDPAIPYTVDENGAFTTDAPGFEGERVITDKGEKGKANEAVIKALASVGMMVARGRLKHQYPHSWRSKKPVIFRNTPQWFIHMDQAIPYLEELSRREREAKKGAGHNAPLNKTLRETSLKSIRETEWVPASGQNRITGMIEAKPDWVVSRQRAWGVPITVFVRKGTSDILLDPEVNARIYDAVFKEGADAWFADVDGARFLKAPTKLAPKGYNPADYEKINDVLDVWFDSGSTHSYVINDPHFPGLMGLKRKVDGGQDTVMYLEGSDQHRGWFHSSLIESSGTRGRAPFDVVLTHGFCLDEKGRKMSKSEGNVVAPQDVIKSSGADILRLWVAASDYSDDLQIGPAILKNFVETYRKMRNTLRWMLGMLGSFEPAHTVGYADMPDLEKYMLHLLSELDPKIRAAYATYDYKKVVSLLSHFMNTDLSAFYFDIRKDALYCEAPSSLKRRAALTCIEHIFRSVTVWLAPILVFTAEECWLSRYPELEAKGGSVHLELFPELPQVWCDETLAETWEKIRRVRRVVTGALELERANKKIGSSLEAAPDVYVTDTELAAALKTADLAEIAITSAAALKSGAAPAGAFTATDVPGVAVVFKSAEGRKCARSWRITADVGSDSAYPDLSARDAAAMREIDG